jgi:hypothetical protein
MNTNLVKKIENFKYYRYRLNKTFFEVLKYAEHSGEEENFQFWKYASRFAFRKL